MNQANIVILNVRINITLLAIYPKEIKQRCGKSTHENILDSVTKNKKPSKYPITKSIPDDYWNITG